MAQTPPPVNQPVNDTPNLDPLDLITRMGLATSTPELILEELSGGVSSDIWVVGTGSSRFVVKRAKHQLNVKTRWVVPLDRGRAEVDWLRYVGAAFPDNVPHVLAFDEESFAIALSYFPPETHTNWKTALMAGDVDPHFAGELGRLLARIHEQSYRHPEHAAQFDNGDLFQLLRIEPFLQRSAAAVPEVAQELEQVVDSLTTHRVALVHGDFSPKNILVDHSANSSRPIVLDAECAVWGDPTFDVAFCLAHLALKSVHVAGAADKMVHAARQFRQSYLDSCPNDLADGVEARLTALVPALLLARVVGGSPVDYLTELEGQRVQDAAVNSLRTGETCGLFLHDLKGIEDSPW